MYDVCTAAVVLPGPRDVPAHCAEERLPEAQDVRTAARERAHAAGDECKSPPAAAAAAVAAATVLPHQNSIIMFVSCCHVRVLCRC